MTLYNTNVDPVNDNGYTKFSLNRFIRFQNIKQLLTYDGMTERLTEKKDDGQGKPSRSPLFQSGTIIIYPFHKKIPFYVIILILLSCKYMYRYMYRFQGPLVLFTCAGYIKSSNKRF